MLLAVVIREKISLRGETERERDLILKCNLSTCYNNEIYLNVFSPEHIVLCLNDIIIDNYQNSISPHMIMSVLYV